MLQHAIDIKADLVLTKRSVASDVLKAIESRIVVTPDTIKDGYQGPESYKPDRGTLIVDYTDGDELPIGTNLLNLQDARGDDYCPDVFITIDSGHHKDGRWYVVLNWEIC